MDTQTLPLVPFGKYKGQPITVLLNDTKYLEWCKQQEWFQKFPIVYNICVNQTITTNNSNSKTPEHNKLQNLFLNNENVEKFLKIIFKKTSKNIQIGSGDIKFEGMFNWDLIVRNYQWWLCECDWSDETKDRCDCEINKKYNERYKIPEGGEDLKFDELYCEIKPLMGDDYPCVLRKMNTQIELTNNYAKKQNEKHEQDMKNKYETDREIRKYYNEQKGLYAYELTQGRIQPKYVLIIKDFNSTTTTKEQLITIFNQSHINIIFIDELFNNLPSQIIREQVEQIQDITIHTTPQQETEEENKLLREKLLHAEEKIKQLEEEILSLKTQKQSKSIKDYFGKK
jgi:uncharacterized protein (DUF3820 family)